MNTIENLVSRRSIRSYKADSVPMELIEKICEAGTYSPSAMNSQSAIIIAVTNEELGKQAGILGSSSAEMKASYLFI